MPYNFAHDVALPGSNLPPELAAEEQNLGQESNAWRKQKSKQQEQPLIVLAIPFMLVIVLLFAEHRY